MAAAVALSESAKAYSDASQPGLLPPLADIRTVSKNIALAVGLQAQNDGVATKTSKEILREKIAATFWEPCYHLIKRQS